MKYELKVTRSVVATVSVEAKSEAEARHSALDIMSFGKPPVSETLTAEPVRRRSKDDKYKKYVSFPELVRRLQAIKPDKRRWGVMASLLRLVVMLALEEKWDIKEISTRVVKRRFRSISCIEMDVFHNGMLAYQDTAHGWDNAFGSVLGKDCIDAKRTQFSVKQYGLGIPVEHPSRLFMTQAGLAVGGTSYNLEIASTARAAGLAAFILVMKGVLKPDFTSDELKLKELEG